MTRMNKDGRPARVIGQNSGAVSGNTTANGVPASVAGDAQAEGGVVICMTGSANMVIERTKMEDEGAILIWPEGDGITMRRVRWE